MGESPATTAGPAGSFTALVPAAGRGERFGGARRKQLIRHRGRPLLWWALEPLIGCGATRVVVGLPGESLEELRRDLEPLPQVLCVSGGRARQDTVRRCLAAAPGEPDELILIHDGARPAVSEVDVRAVIEEALEADGAILGRPVADTLKRVEHGVVLSTVERDGLYRAETPQVFRRRLLQEALERAAKEGLQPTDEASLIEGLEGVTIRVVVAQRPNPKVTFAGDFALAAQMIDSRKRTAAGSPPTSTISGAAL